MSSGYPIELDDGVEVRDATMTAFVVAVMAQAGYSVECIALSLARIDGVQS